MDKFYTEIQDVLNEIYFSFVNANCILNIKQLKEIFELELECNEIKYQ